MKTFATVLFVIGAIVAILGYSGRLKGKHERKWLALSLILVVLGGGYISLKNL